MVAVAGGGMTEGGGAAVVGVMIGDTMCMVIVLAEQPVVEPRTVAGDMRVVVVTAAVEASGEFYEGLQLHNITPDKSIFMKILNALKSNSNLLNVALFALALGILPAKLQAAEPEVTPAQPTLTE